MNNQILLSICIPTYNRPAQFKRMIGGLLPQLTSETELVIRDDSANDETKIFFDEFIKKMNPPAKFNYFKGEKIGLDLANLFLLEKAEGKYMWWFSDDDEITPGAISQLLKTVKLHPEISFVWANFCIADSGQIAMSWPKDKFFKDRNEVLELGANIGLLSTLIMKREDGIKFLPIARKYAKGFSFASLVPVFGILSGNGKFYFLRGPYVVCHPTSVAEFKEANKEKIINQGFQVYGIDFYDIVNIFRDKFDSWAIKKMLAKNFGNLWRGMLVAWVGGWDTPKGKRWKMFQLYWNFPEFWLALPFFLLPRFTAAFFYRVYKVFFNERKLRLKRK